MEPEEQNIDFLTQSSFLLDENIATQTAAESANYFMNLFDNDDPSMTSDLLENTRTSSAFRDTTSITPKPAAPEVHASATADISDDELVLSCEAMEQRFGEKPLDDNEVSSKAKRR